MRYGRFVDSCGPSPKLPIDGRYHQSVACRWAGLSAMIQGVGSRTNFRCADAEQVEFPDESFEIVWSVECTEHLFDKQRFFERSARWLTRGGRMAICAWLAGEDGSTRLARSRFTMFAKGSSARVWVRPPITRVGWGTLA